MKRIVQLVLLLALLAGCAKKESPYDKMPLPPERIAMPGYSLMPVNEPGWVRVKGAGLVLSRYGASVDETEQVMGSVIAVPQLAGVHALRHFFKRTMVDDVYSGRYEPVSLDFEELNYRGARCVRSHLVSIDRYPVTFDMNSTKTMRLESYQQLCLHPDDFRAGVLIAVTQQYYPGNEDAAFADKAVAVLESLRFSKP